MRRPALAALIFILGCLGCKKSAPPPAAPPAVQVITVTPQDVPVYQQWIGTLDGYPNARIRAQVSGYLLKQNYTEGAYVKEGALLFEIDQRPFQAILDAAKARLAEDQAQQGKTGLDVKRYRPLVAKQAISQEELDNAIQADLAAQATVKADEATVESAQLNLNFCNITAPISGIAGTATAQIGDLVGPGGQILTTISTVDPIRVYFALDEQSYLEFVRQYTNAAALATHEQDMPMQLILSDGTVYPQPGKWFFISRDVDQSTGAFQVAAQFPNPDHILRPGQYGQIRARTSIHKGAILIPQRAVNELQGSYQVTSVDATNAAHIKTVTVGEQIGQNWLIKQGLSGGERIIVEGLQRAKEGTIVAPQPYAPSSTNSPASAASAKP